MSTLQVDRITPYQSASIQIDGDVVQANAATTGSNTFVGDQTITGNINAKDIILDDPGAITSLTLNPNYSSELYGAVLRRNEISGLSDLQLSGFEAQAYLNAWSGAYDHVCIQTVDAVGVKFEDWDPGAGYATSIWLQVPNLGTPTFKRGVEVTGSLFVSSSAAEQVKFNVANGAKEFLVDNGPNEFYTFNDQFNNLRKSDGEGLNVSQTYGFNAYNSTFTKDIGFSINMNTSAGTGTNKSGIWGVGSGGYYDFISFEDSTNWTDGRIEIHRTLQVDQVLQLQAQDPLPAGALGQLAVSGSDLYFHNGSGWVVK